MIQITISNNYSNITHNIEISDGADVSECLHAFQIAMKSAGYFIGNLTTFEPDEELKDETREP